MNSHCECVDRTAKPGKAHTTNDPITITGMLNLRPRSRRLLSALKHAPITGASLRGLRQRDDSRALCLEPHVFHVRIGIEAIARFLAEAGEAREVDPDQLPVALHDLARDKHGIDVL
jgi:hypothetical protein